MSRALDCRRALHVARHPVNLSSIDLNLLHLLHVVLVEESVVRAAERLRITPSGVSNALARLRKTLDDPLLVRVGKRLVATPRARQMQPGLASAIVELESVLRTGDRFEPVSSTQCWTIGSSDHAAALLLPALVRALGERAPKSSIRVVSTDAALSARALARGDASLLLGDFAEVLERCRITELGCDAMAAIVRRSHPQIRRALTLDAYVAWPHVHTLAWGDETNRVDRALEARNRTRTIGLVVPNFLLAATVVGSTDCIATLPRRIAERFAPAFDLQVFDPPLPVGDDAMQLMWHERTNDGPAEVFLRTIIREIALSEFAGSGKVA